MPDRLALLFAILLAWAGVPAAPASAAVRAGDHKNFGRLVLEWDGPVMAREVAVEGGLRLQLSRGVEGDLAAALARIPRWLAAIEPSPDRAGLTLRHRPGVAAGLTRAGPGKLIIDFKLQPAASSGPPSTAPDRPAAEDPGVADAPVADPVDATVIPVPQPRPVLSVVASSAAALPVAAPPVAAVPPVAEPSAGPTPPAQPAPALPGLVDQAAVPGLQARRHGDVVELEITWPEPVPAAAFRRAGQLWLLFGRPPSGPAPEAVARVSPALATLAIRPHAGMTVLTLADPTDEVALVRRGTTWTARLGRKPALPTSPVAWPPQHGELRIAGAAMLGEIDDPVVGDRLGVALFLEPGRAEPAGRAAVGLELLPSLQGVVWKASADGVAARADAQGVAITLPAAFADAGQPMEPALQPDPPAPAGAHAEPRTVEPAPSPVAAAPHPAPPHAEGGTVASPADPGPGARRPVGPIDLAAGTLRPGQTARDQRRRLEQAVREATPVERTGRRVELARMLLAQELAAEAGATLSPVEVADPAAGALAGVAALLRGQLDAAARELGRAGLDGDAEVALWRAALAAARRDWPAARREWRSAGGVPAGYADALRIRLGVVGSQIELSGGRSDAALALLDRLHDLPKSPEAAARIRLAEALALDAQKAVRKAAAALAEAAAGGDRETRLEAERQRIAWDQRDGRITPDAALARLQAMRPAWRGHPDEIAFLDDIGRLEAGQGDLSAAIGAWQEAIGGAADPRAAEGLRHGLQERLTRSLLGQGDSPPLSPLAALSLYRRHHDLLPAGAALAEVERRLATRLARAGIESPASALLHRHIDLGGSAGARAEAGAALAEAHLAQDEAEAALAVLRSTGPEAGLPSGLAEQRRGVRGRALAAAGADAAKLADADEQRVRLRLAWADGDWGQIEAAAAAILAGETAGGTDRSELVLTLALARAKRGDATGVSALARERAAEVADGPDRALLAMLAAATVPLEGPGLAPVEAGVGAVRAYLASAAGAGTAAPP